MQAESPTITLKGAKLWPLSIEAYHVLGDAGVIPQNTELLYGFVYTKMPKSPIHIYLLHWLLEALTRELGAAKWVGSEQPIICGDSEPEPDLSVVAGTKEDYKLEHPRTADLVIEICVSSHDYDRFKLRAYALADIKEVWLVLGPEKQIEIFRNPKNGEYQDRALFGPGGQVTCGSFPKFKVDLVKLFA